ncbi:hypothetical protein [Paenibacillus sp. PDC88]|uniref:hypothetical protein n=1 Tax=Paenibacillus sp. PDC88 TaxID=1884375 RepID=UPI00089652D4|nr:hypothetical protein [Paenibacillus sp. PDC88]SDX05473.1 hypothetical protein SAMN05518848_104214 [Paenibacillus sp. PDC88]
MAVNKNAQEELDLEVTQEEKGLERQAAKAEKTILQQLKASKKVEITIPDDPQNPGDKVVAIGLGGVVYTVPRGIPTEVPEPIALIWRDSYNRTREANQRIEDSTRKEVKIM